MAAASSVGKWQSHTWATAAAPVASGQMVMLPAGEATTSPKYSVFDLKQGLVCQDAGCSVSANQKAKQIFSTVQKVYQFFDEKFGLKGIDGQGTVAPIYIGWDEDNAAWTCKAYMEGKQCSWKFNDKYIRDPAVVAHEWTHAIIGSLAPIGNVGEAGALGEALSDAFGVHFREWLTGKRNWVIVDRDLAAHPAPYKPLIGEPSPANDFGWVHANSTIVSHAYQQIVCGVGCLHKDAAIHIFFKALKQMKFDETFSRFALKTVAIAKTIFVGPEHNNWNAFAARQVAEAWEHVGVGEIVSATSEKAKNLVGISL
jgi:Zn-dependent metalloprotease